MGTKHRFRRDPARSKLSRATRATLRLALAGVVLLGPAESARAYNHDQHMGLVAIAYKAMVAAVMEKGCLPPYYFALEDLTPSLRSFPAGFCDGDPGACQARWTAFLTEFERGIRFLRSVDSSLTAPSRAGCQDPRSGANTLGEVELAVDRYYNREPGAERGFCGTLVENASGCSAPVSLCDSGSLYQYLDPGDHTGDILGYWATAPDDDASCTALGFKPTSVAGVGKTVDTVNDVVETVVGALVVPLVCAWRLFSEGDLDCLDDAKELADDAVPIEEVLSIVPVIGAIRDADALAGLWHFQNNVPGASNECDDRQGILYEEAGPLHIPDALDLSFVILGDAFGLTLNHDASTGPERFNITDPGDGDPPSCSRDRADWEFQTLGHTAFSPIDNLGLYGWKRFATSLHADELGWPLHALGDAVAPHHVAATTGWGHRPFEDAAELHWGRIIYVDTPSPSNERIRLQYEQLRRILAWAFHYAQVLDRLRAERPTGQAQNEIPVRALITEVAADTLAETTSPGGAPLWPFDPTLSVPYVLDAAVKTQFLTAIYGTEPAVAGTRALLERGAGAVAAFLSSVWRIQGDTALPPFPPCDPFSEGGFFECGGPNAFCAWANYPNTPPYGCCAVNLNP